MDGKKNEISLFRLLRASDYVDVFDAHAFEKEEHHCQSLIFKGHGPW